MREKRERFLVLGWESGHLRVTNVRGGVNRKLDFWNIELSDWYIAAEVGRPKRASLPCEVMRDFRMAAL